MAAVAPLSPPRDGLAYLRHLQHQLTHFTLLAEAEKAAVARVGREKAAAIRTLEGSHAVRARLLALDNAKCDALPLTRLHAGAHRRRPSPRAPWICASRVPCACRRARGRVERIKEAELAAKLSRLDAVRADNAALKLVRASGV